MEATTARDITFATTRRNGHVGDIRTFPAGTSVYVSEKHGEFIARVAGTLYTQTVYLSAVTPA
jgi:hypothetical protein